MLTNKLPTTVHSEIL